MFLSFNLIEFFVLHSILIIIFCGLWMYNKQVSMVSCDSLSFLSGLTLIEGFLLGCIISDSQVGSYLGISDRIYFQLILIIVFLFVLLVQQTYISQNMMTYFEFIVILFLSFLSFLFLLKVEDIISFYIVLELQGLSFYLLAFMLRNNRFAIESGMQYYLLGCLASSFIMLGFSFLYGLTGCIFFEDWFWCSMYMQSHTFVLSFIFILISVGFLFKIYAVPFHYWIAEIYGNVGLNITLFYSILPHLVFFVLLYQFYVVGLFFFYPIWSIFLYISSIGCLLIGAIFAFQQRELRRLLAYGSVSHTGYLLLGLLGLDINLLTAVFFYLLIYMFVTLLLFSIFMSKGWFDIRKDKWYSSLSFMNDLTHLNGYGLKNVLPGFFIGLGFLSFAGLPPLLGFVGKGYILFMYYSQSLYILLGVMWINAGITCSYYVRIVKNLYFEEYTGYKYYSTSHFSSDYCILIFGLGLISLIFYGDFIISLSGICSHILVL